MNTVDALWNSALGEIELEVSRGTFASFFKGTGIKSEKEDSFTVICPNNASLHMLQNRYAPLIRVQIERRHGKPIFLDFEASLQTKTDAGPLFTVRENQETVLRRVGINPKYSFDNYAVSDTNQMAFAAAQAVANRPGKSYNPLFLWGTTGVGKTHLMQAIGRTASQLFPDIKIVCCTGEEFTNEIIEAIRTRTAARFKQKYRSAGLFLVDDVQFIAGKETVQMEFFHTFNSILNAGGQVVLTSDNPPASINQLESRLRSRFEGGLIIDISAPSFELRTAILLIKAGEYNVSLPIETAKSFAASVENARALEGLLLRYITEEQSGKNQTEIVSSVLSGGGVAVENKEHTATNPNRVVAAACSFFGLKEAQLIGKGRKRSFVVPRQLVMFIMRQDIGLSFEEIGGLLGGRDHTTIMHGVEKIQALLPKKDVVRENISQLRRLVWG